jgi:hypothetical protein
MELLSSELAGPTPSPFERLLVERVVACKLQVTCADIRWAEAGPDMTLTQGEYHDRCRDRAHKRFLSAIRTLALVRKLATPVLQMSVTRGQVNAAAAGAVVDGGESKPCKDASETLGGSPAAPGDAGSTRSVKRTSQKAACNHRCTRLDPAPWHEARPRVAGRLRQTASAAFGHRTGIAKSSAPSGSKAD